MAVKSVQLALPVSSDCVSSDRNSAANIQLLQDRAASNISELALPSWSLSDVGSQQRTMCLLASTSAWNAPGVGPDDDRFGEEGETKGCRSSSRTSSSRTNGKEIKLATEYGKVERGGKACLLCAEHVTRYDMPRFHNLQSAIAGKGSDAIRLLKALKDLKIGAPASSLRGAKVYNPQKGSSVCRLMVVLRDV
jgi:hypothetical protein